jgi:alkylated DNA repair dioxygenase AlkB
VIGDLFSENAKLEKVPMQDAEVYFLRYLALARPADALIHHLIAEAPWRVEKLVVWGKSFLQPRLVAWYGDRGSNYTYSGISLDPLPWTEILLDIKGKVEAVAEATFNSVLLNYYRNNQDSMGFHSDDERELGERPLIASLSLGEERTLVLKHKTTKTVKPVRLKLPCNSLLLMKGETQKNWKHGIDKETRFCGPRINFTFRRIQTS